MQQLRHSITYLVTEGFSLAEIRKLHIDEFIQFSNSITYIKEKKGELKKGTYKQMRAREKGTVSSLKSQLFNIKPHGK